MFLLVYYSERIDLDKADRQSGRTFEEIGNWNWVSYFASPYNDRRIILVTKCDRRICNFHKDINTKLCSAFGNIYCLCLLLYNERPIGRIIRLQHSDLVCKQLKIDTVHYLYYHSSFDYIRYFHYIFALTYFRIILFPIFQSFIVITVG